MPNIIDQVIQLVKELRGVNAPCAWTQAQTFESLNLHTLEEACELAEAITQKNPTAIKDELGDLLYHIIFYAQMAEEQALFNLEDISQAILDKRQRRLPSPQKRKQMTAEEINHHWQQAKQQEKSTLTLSQCTPALQKMIKKFKHSRADDQQKSQASLLLSTLGQKIGHLSEHHNKTVTQQNYAGNLLTQYGELLLACLQLGHCLQLNPEEALHHVLQNQVEITSL